jgi:cholest-4-en-3-one 26-monooxygenase
MATKPARPQISIFDVDTYGNGDPTTFGMPLDQFAYLREYEPCLPVEFDNPILPPKVYVLSRHADCEAADRDPDTWAADLGWFNVSYGKLVFHDPINNPEGKPSVITTDHEIHRRQRTVMGRSFTPAAVKAMEDRFRAIARQIVDHALELGTFNFVTEVANRMPMEALGDVLGVPQEDRRRFFGWVDCFVAPFDPRVTTDLSEVLEVNRSLFRYALELRDKRADAPGEDVISQVVKAAVNERMSDDELQGNVLTLAAGAGESTRSTLSHGMHELMRRPEQMEILRAQADDIPPTAVQEMVRIATPFTHFVRTARKDAEFHGQEIRQGELIAMFFAAGNFDPEAFDEPNEFDVLRDPNAHLSFGRGPHSCLGKHMAALEIKVLLEELLQRTREIRPAGSISYMREVFSRGVYELPVTVVPA